MARPRPAIKLVPLVLFCKKCQKEVTAVSVKSNRNGKRFNIDYDSFRVEEAAETASREQSRVVCGACGTPLSSPIEFFCPHCFEASGYYDDGMHVQGQLLNSIDCVKSMLKEIEKRLTDVDFARWYPAAAQPNSQLPRQQFYDRNSGVAPTWPLGQSSSQHSRWFSRRLTLRSARVSTTCCSPCRSARNT